MGDGGKVFKSGMSKLLSFGLIVWSVKFASLSHDKPSANTFLVPLMYCIFHLYKETSMDKLLTL